ncbi:uncharacterized protein LOC119745382 isoform X2 [Patiria miniata]|uniref:Uncharacterized protein n=1 Tax=Patiria miniata TaxID=46514 RepID=A0A914BQ55_PATMI|nr:uncharacterized protein LOC119745382 isoform X2 [Patiria miniata]
MPAPSPLLLSFNKQLRTVNLRLCIPIASSCLTMQGEYGSDGLFHCIVGGLRYDDFDKAGKISIGKISKILEGVRIARITQGITSQNIDFGLSVLYVRSHYFKVYPSFYSLSQTSSLKFTTFTSHIGRTSFCVDANAFDLTTGELLATCSTHSVFVSMETRRPTPIPPEMAQMSQVIPTEDKRPVSGPDFPAQPSACFTQKRMVFPGDTDANEHLNQAVFIRFCFDCASGAALEGKLPSFVHDIIFSDAKTVWVRYVREAEVGEELTLSCWEDGDQKQTVWVEIYQESQVIGQCQIQFYDDELNNSTSKSEEARAISKL